MIRDMNLRRQNKTMTSKLRELHEVDRREIFVRVVGMQDGGATVGDVRASVAAKYGLSADDIVEIETEGISKQWPPLSQPVGE